MLIFGLCSTFDDCQAIQATKVDRNVKRPPEMIQSNFYERLYFYMDSCAINPPASLFVLESFVNYIDDEARNLQHYLLLSFQMTSECPISIFGTVSGFMGTFAFCFSRCVHVFETKIYVIKTRNAR